MATDTRDGGEDTECPTCGRDDFASRQGLLQHRRRGHGEEIREEVACDNCGRSLSRTPANINEGWNFCDYDCMSEFYAENSEEVKHDTREVVGCDFCGEELLLNEARRERSEHHFCDQTCKGRWMSENLTGEAHPNAKEKVATECSNCGADITRHPHRIQEYEKHFCSQECVGEHQSQHQTGKQNPNWSGRVTKTCQYCGTEFDVRPSRETNDPTKYCSYSCHSKDRTGEDAPNWKGGKAPYGPGWNDTKKSKARRRDGFACRRCGMSSEAHVESHGVDLHVHHLTPAREVDDPTERNAMDNLITLCVECHWLFERQHPLIPQVD